MSQARHKRVWLVVPVKTQDPQPLAAAGPQAEVLEGDPGVTILQADQPRQVEAIADRDQRLDRLAASRAGFTQP
jgi:hypothetical protein